ncbi:transposase, partial [bacterium]|nr:transposase [bacterium]
GFPFDCPHLIFYQRLEKLHELINAQCIKDRNLSRLWQPVTKVIEDRQLKKAVSQMQKKVDTFKKLREALSITDSNSKKGLNDDGQDADIRSIEEKVKRFRNEVIPASKDFEKMTEQIDKYWEKLFADPITVTSSAGEVTIQPQRTNNILERFFRDLKRSTRRRSGTVSLNKTLRFMLTDTPIVKNLNKPEYLEIILDGCRTLEERFERIDSRLVAEKLKAEQRKHQIIGSEMKKIIKLPDLPERLSAIYAL